MFVDELIRGYYEKKVSKAYEFGDIYFTETYYPHENAEFFRPVAFEDNKMATHATHFRIRTDKPFQHGLPLQSPRLEIDEEFIVVKAKQRPVILLQPHIEIAGIATSGHHSPLYRKQSLVAQVYSVQHPVTAQLKFPLSFIERIREIEYPQLLFLPTGDALNVDSIARLDACQSVFTSRLKSTGVQLHEDARELLRSQFQCMINHEYSGYYQLYRDEILRSKAKVATT